MSDTFYIKKTAFDDNNLDAAQRDADSFIIGPGELNGPGGLAQASDLELYGFGSLKWGEGVNQNQYRMLESFACPQKETGDYYAEGSPPEGAYISGLHDIMPKDENDLGDGNGITNPIIGQRWYNTTDKTLYTYTGGSPTEWRSSMTAPNILDMTGYGIYNLGDPRDAYNTLQGAILYPNDAVNVGYADDRYVNLTGDTMTGILDMNSNRVENIADPAAGTDGMSRNYADTRYINAVGGDQMFGELDMVSNKIVNLGNATTASDAMNRVTSDGRYLAKDIDSTFNDSNSLKVLTVKNNDGVTGVNSSASFSGGLEIKQDTSGADAFITFNEGGSSFNFGRQGSTNDLFVGGGSWGATRYKVWHEGNDGPGSGLNADYLDSYSSSSFLKTTDGYQRSDITYPSYVWSRTTYNTGANNYVYETLPYPPGRPSWANYVLYRFEWTCYNGNIQDLRWAHASLNGFLVIGLGADDTDQGYVSAPVAVSEVWVPYSHRSLAWTVYHGGGGANQKLTIRRIGWHQ